MFSVLLRHGTTTANYLTIIQLAALAVDCKQRSCCAAANSQKQPDDTCIVNFLRLPHLTLTAGACKLAAGVLLPDMWVVLLCNIYFDQV
jgi:hypothetical protein